MMSPKENSTRCTEGRPRPEGISGGKAKVRTQGRAALPANLARVNEAARRSHKTRFTALMHHIDVEALRRAFNRQRRNASAGVDGITVEEYRGNLEANLKRLCDQVHSGCYRPQPVRRAYVPKSDGAQRPIGIPALEDKIVQGAVAEVLSAIYEVDFLGFTHYCCMNRNGYFFVMRKTQRARMIRKLKELRIEARRRMHWPLRKQQRWLAAVLRGHYGYYGYLRNSRALSNFAYEVRKLWFRTLCRRSQKDAMTWERFNRLLKVFPLPVPRIIRT